jgi:molybdopterin-binding protein
MVEAGYNGINKKEDNMKLSARNQIKGKVLSVETGAVMAKVKIDIGGGNTLTSLISKESVDDLALKAGDGVTAIIKSTEVMIGK